MPQFQKPTRRTSGGSAASRPLDLAAALVGVLFLLAGCKDSKPSPPAQRLPANPRIDSGQDEEEDDQDEPARQNRPTRQRQPAHSAETINGHPKGPKAGPFNAVVRSAYAKANACFASRIQALGKGPFTMKVRITVGNNGRVRQARITEGVKDEQVRNCVLTVFRSLKFPAYQGPEVSQVVPLTVVRAQ